jgi:hypothetical protein
MKIQPIITRNFWAVKVFWVFDEDQSSIVETMGPEIKYTFQYQANRKEPLWNRRVDAFFKSGGSYRSAYDLVSVANTSFPATVGLDGSSITFKVPASLTVPATQRGASGFSGGSDWKLTDAKLGTFQNAAARDKVSLPCNPKSTASSGCIVRGKVSSSTTADTDRFPRSG